MVRVLVCMMFEVGVVWLVIMVSIGGGICEVVVWPEVLWVVGYRRCCYGGSCGGGSGDGVMK